MDRSRLPVRKRRLGHPDDDDTLRRMSPAERLALVWPLTLQAWSFAHGLQDEPRLRRDVGRVIRGGR